MLVDLVSSGSPSVAVTPGTGVVSSVFTTGPMKQVVGQDNWPVVAGIMTRTRLAFTQSGGVTGARAATRSSHQGYRARVHDPDAVVDLTFVQMIEAGRKTAGAAGRGFRLATAASGALLETLGRGGFLESPGDRDFWLSESGN